MSPLLNSFRSPAYRWVIVVLAALAMVATLPGRTHGLSMITERLLSDSSLQLDRLVFGYINLWATLGGALFCIPAGWMLDRCGLRVTSTLIVALLGAVVIAMTNASGIVQFAILICLTRGLGQSALSVVSISMTGKWFRTNLALATGIYSLLVSVGFVAAFLWGRSQSDWDWRTQWAGLGAILLFVIAPTFALFVRSAPQGSQDESQADHPTVESPWGLTDFTLSAALATPAFWMFGLATSLYGLVSSGVSLFSESLLMDRGFEKTAFYDLGTMTTAIGLAGNLVTGWMATRINITVLAAIAMSLLAAALLALPFVSTYSELVAYAVAMGFAGGMVTVLFFTIWAQLFGRTELGKIQGVAQMLTVIASALGPVVLAEVKVRTGSYVPAIVSLGGCAAVLAVGMLLVPIPARESQLLTNANLDPNASP
ncbi:MAG: transporter [Planctomycetaceae bacterium]|nr:transporter [Planctomycetaceae bacterium]